MMPPRKSAITVTSRADAAKSGAVELARRNPALARRLAGNPHGGGTKALPMKEPGRYHTYIANNYADEGELLRMKERGWVPLEPGDLACSVEETGFRLSPDGYMVRGPQGQEMVFKMAAEDYALLQQAKTDVNNRGIGSASRIKADMANAAAGQLGGEAAEYINSLEGSVVDRITGGEAQ